MHKCNDVASLRESGTKRQLTSKTGLAGAASLAGAAFAGAAFLLLAFPLMMLLLYLMLLVVNRMQLMDV